MLKLKKKLKDGYSIKLTLFKDGHLNGINDYFFFNFLIFFFFKKKKTLWLLLVLYFKAHL
jgi:hypothetical protein